MHVHCNKVSTKLPIVTRLNPQEMPFEALQNAYHVEYGKFLQNSYVQHVYSYHKCTIEPYSLTFIPILHIMSNLRVQYFMMQWLTSKFIPCAITHHARCVI